MRTFSLNKISADYAARVLKTMEDNKGYIVFFNGANTKEAYQRIFLQAMKSEDRSYTDLTPYIKILARNVMRQKQRDIPYAPYDEQGEVAFVFTTLAEEDDPLQYDNKAQITAVLEELYLRCPEDFMLLGQLLPSSEAEDIKCVIKNESLKQAVFNLVREYGGNSVFYSICDFLKELAKEKAVEVNEGVEKVINLRAPNYKLAIGLGSKKWLKDKDNNIYGINERTLCMDGGFNPEFHQFRLAIPTTCRIWKIDCSDYYNAIENKIYVDQGVDNEYIRWCRDRFSLTTPGGQRFIGTSRDKFMEAVRQELILGIIGFGLGNIIALSPDNVYIKLTKASSISSIKINTVFGKTYILPATVQEVVAAK